jgi:hypothetical protein
MIIGQQHIGQEEPEVLCWDSWETIGQRLEEADKVVGKGAVEAEKTIRTPKGVEKMPENLGNIVELQPLILGHWSTLTRHRPLYGLSGLADIRTAGEIRWLQARQDILSTAVEGSQTKGVILPLDQHGWIDDRQGVSTIDP